MLVSLSPASNGNFPSIEVSVQRTVLSVSFIYVAYLPTMRFQSIHKMSHQYLLVIKGNQYLTVIEINSPGHLPRCTGTLDQSFLFGRLKSALISLR